MKAFYLCDHLAISLVDVSKFEAFMQNVRMYFVTQHTEQVFMLKNNKINEL